jgi:OOP family OmpA-OmpF porin
MLSFNWHFRKPEAKPAPVAGPLPAPEPQKKQVVDTYELQVQFDFDKSNIKSVYEPQFEEIGQILKDNPGINMTVEGHTCWIGTEEYNQGLSERRADSVKQKFVSDYGIAGDRISTIGFGETRPIATNETLEGRRKNRRAIAVILVPRK